MVLHTLVVLAAIGAYVALSLTGHDGNDVLVAGFAYGTGAAVQAKASGGGA